ncbi:SusD/RagB family nutrient-binding outer membrane lipoprotein [Fulvivirga sp. M361]|uniref:SusD/RagB family nutrient-binding outer membrane lipoprotein n=1 Tax=Fulvivirga sp. M361 TaxID=2594266 RepID=UPI001179C934|nr:SusD/RagB family nutrient-binding outer membrane lipoprotein [Fulvivirga sp. M361]TRX52196.1 SusD/RagB family nutrient-binding outer membrane lipoprotein [Fulvivirga sp. M361]
MNRFRRSYLAINKTMLQGVLVILMVTACTSDFDEMNVSPVAVQEDRINEDLLFTRALVYGMLRYTELQRAQHLYTHHYIQYYSVAVDYFQTGRYITRNDWLTAYWTEAYADFGMQCQQVINLTRDNPEKVNKTSIARIWKVFIMHRITDFWGDVPYSEAFSGDITPVYDKQADIYRDMLSELENAVAQIDPSKTLNFQTSDVMYRGDLDLWIRFANSLRLRLAMRISDADPALAQEHVTAILAENRLIENNSQSAIMNYGRDFGGADENVQPMSLIKSFNEYRMSNTIIDYLQDNNDPRLPIYASPAEGGNYVGLTNGLNPAEVNEIIRNDYSQDSEIISNVYSPSTALQYSEVNFLKAEAALKGWGPGNPQDHYEEGIRASVNYWLDVYTNLQTRVPNPDALPVIEVTSLDIDNYLQEPAISYDNDNALEQIITQKWLANINNGFESWAEYRRTGFPLLNPIPNTDGLSETGGTSVPVRVRYPIEELSLNQLNYEAAVQNNPDLVTTRVWWDVN